MIAKFITFEGGEGSGKSTQIGLLCQALEGVGKKIVKTREPGGTPQGEKIREILVTGDASKLLPVSELLLNLAARHEHVENVIKPALEKGRFVVSDRFYDSTIAYQGYGHGLGEAYTRSLLQQVIGNFKPALTIILDIPSDKGLNRAKKRGDKENRYEQMQDDFHALVRKGFLSIARSEPDRCVVIDAKGSIEQVHRKIISIVNSRFFLNLEPIRS